MRGLAGQGSGSVSAFVWSEGPSVGDRGGKTGPQVLWAGGGVSLEVQGSWEALIGSHVTDVLGLLWLTRREG